MLACSALNTASRKQQIDAWEASEMGKEVVTPRPPDRVKFPMDVQFHAACKNSELDEVKALLSKGIDINVANVDGLTVLHQACIDNNYEVVKFLLSNNADVNAQDHEGWTPLHACASCSYTELAKLLLENGADPGIVSFELELPLDVAQGNDMVVLLKDWMQRQSIDEKAARSAEEQQMLRDVQEWLQSGQYPRIVDPRTGATALHIAAAKGYSEALELLLKLPDVDVDATDMDGWTPLHAAAHWAKEKSLRLLAAAGASFDIITLTNQSIYDVADRSVTMLLRQLRVEQQRSAASNAEGKPAVSPPPTILATRRKAEDVEEKEALRAKKAEENKENENEEDVKPSASKVPKTSQDKVKEEQTKEIKEEPESKTGLEEEEEEEEEELLEKAKMLQTTQKDEVAMKVKKEEEEKIKQDLKEKREDGQTVVEEKSLPSPSPPPSLSLPTAVPSAEVVTKADGQSSKATSLEEDAEKLTAPSPPKTSTVISKPVRTVQPTNQNSQVSETSVTLDTTSMPTGGVPGRSLRRGRKDNTTIKRISAVLAPARSEETEAQRCSKARLVRSTRRSTQGIPHDVLEEARRITAAGASTPSSSSAVTLAARPAIAHTVTAASPTPTQTDDKALSSFPIFSVNALTSSTQPQPSPQPTKSPPKSFASKVTLGHLAQPSTRKSSVTSGAGDVEEKPTPFSNPTTTTHVTKATITPVQPPSASPTGAAADTSTSSIVAHSRARRAARDRVPTGLLDTNDVLAAAKQLEQNAPVDSTATATPTSTATVDPIPRPTTRLLRSTILNTSTTATNSTASNNDTVSNGGGGDRRTSPLAPQTSPTLCSSSGKPVDQRYNWRENLDYRLLYEEERSEKERLKRTLDQVTLEVAALRNELARFHVSSSASTPFAPSKYGGSASNTDSSSSTLQRRTVEFFEDQAKEIDRLRQENARMADENKSLIRVISKLSAHTTS